MWLLPEPCLPLLGFTHFLTTTETTSPSSTSPLSYTAFRLATHSLAQEPGATFLGLGASLPACHHQEEHPRLSCSACGSCKSPLWAPAVWIRHHSTGRKVFSGKSGREQAVSTSCWLGRVWERHRASPPGSRTWQLARDTSLGSLSFLCQPQPWDSSAEGEQLHL